MLKTKNLYFVSGTMGVGKTAVCQCLKKRLQNSVFLDGDWCWDASPLQVTEETKEMVIDNICYLLNHFIHCTAYNNVIFCWVMHEQNIIDSILKRLDTSKCVIKNLSLIVDEENLRKRLAMDITNGIRDPDVLERSVARISLYKKLDTVKVDTSGKSVEEIADEILSL